VRLAELDRRPECLGDGIAQTLDAGVGLLRLKNSREPLLGPAQRLLSTAANLPKDRGQQPGELEFRRNGDQSDPGPVGDVRRGSRRTPPAVGVHDGDGGYMVDRRPAQRHVDPVILGQRRCGAGEHDETPRGGRFEVREPLRELHSHDQVASAARVDTLQLGER